MIFTWNVAGAKICVIVVPENVISLVVPFFNSNDKLFIISPVTIFIKLNLAPFSSVTPDILPHKTISYIPVTLTSILIVLETVNILVGSGIKVFFFYS